jgi:uncharacterized protein
MKPTVHLNSTCSIDLQSLLESRLLIQLPGPERRILQPLLDAYPNSIVSEQLAEMAGYSHTSTGFTNPRARLRTLGLIEYLPDQMVRARSILSI